MKIINLGAFQLNRVKLNPLSVSSCFEASRAEIYWTWLLMFVACGWQGQYGWKFWGNIHWILIYSKHQHISNKTPSVTWLTDLNTIWSFLHGQYWFKTDGFASFWQPPWNELMHENITKAFWELCCPHKSLLITCSMTEADVQ